VLRYLTAGESHGRALTVIVEGLPAGLPILASHIEDDLARRRLGYGRGPRQRFEQDVVTLVGGVRLNGFAVISGMPKWRPNPVRLNRH
jgi:chorismate synthase